MVMNNGIHFMVVDNDDNSALALIDATEQEAETKQFFTEFDDEYISLLDKITRESKKTSGKENLTTRHL